MPRIPENSELKKLHRKHEQEVSDFIKACPHTELTNWQKWAWTSDGQFQWWGRYCERCESLVESDKRELKRERNQ